MQTLWAQVDTANRAAGTVPHVQKPQLEQARQAEKAGRGASEAMKVSNRYILLISLLFTLCLCALAFGQEKPKTYTPNENQALRLKNKQLEALLAKDRLDAAQKAFQDSLKALTDEAELVKKEQGWSKEVQFDPNTTQFSEPPKEQKK